MMSINSKKKGQAKNTSRIASPVQTYPAPSPTPVTQPEPEPSQKLETPAPESVEEKIPFSFTIKEQIWLTTTTAEPLPLSGESAKWAGFTMLYSLYYWESELDSLKELGIMPSFQREYDRLFNVTNDLLRLVTEATTQQTSREFKEKEKQSLGFTGQIAFDFINRFSNSWRDIPKYFPWRQFTTDQVSLMLGKFLELLHRLKNILADIQALKEEVLKPLGEFLRDITPLLKLMKRLSDYTYEQEKPEPIPLYVSGEIKEITDDCLVVTVEHSSHEDEEWTIPRQDFPEEKPRVGQRFFGVIKQEQPDKLAEIKPMPVREKKSFDELFISLFGREAYEVVSARWKEEEEDT
jgi:hypothetical protein